jgi:hypothetical protein
MEKKWREYGGEGTFNCVRFDLDESIIQCFINDLEEDKLNFDAKGFFFGRATSPSDEDYQEFKAKTLNIFKELLYLTQKGATFQYNSWW